MQVVFIISLIEMSFSFDQMKSDLAESKNEFSKSCIASDERTEESKLVMKKRQRENQSLKRSQKLNSRILHHFRCFIRVQKTIIRAFK